MNVCKLLGIFTAIAISVGANAGRPVPLGNACVDQLKEQILQKESAYFRENFKTEIGEPEVWGYGSLQGDGTYTFNGTIYDLTDGRAVDYRAAKISKKDAESCNIELKRDATFACRYSSDGDDEFQDRSGAKFVREVTLKPTTKLSKIEEEQIVSFLENNDTPYPASELIAATDDGEITKRVVEFKNGVRADYYKAYGGDNPFGVFYRQNTMEMIGENSDDSICIKYAVEK